MRKKPHTHPCGRCGVKVACFGELSGNHDGFPEVICLDYHLLHGEIADVFCDEHSNYDREDLTAPDAWEGGFAKNH